MLSGQDFHMIQVEIGLILVDKNRELFLTVFEAARRKTMIENIPPASQKLGTKFWVSLFDSYKFKI